MLFLEILIIASESVEGYRYAAEVGSCGKTDIDVRKRAELTPLDSATDGENRAYMCCEAVTTHAIIAKSLNIFVRDCQKRMVLVALLTAWAHAHGTVGYRNKRA